MLMIKFKTYGEVFAGFYIAEDSNQEFRVSATNADASHMCLRGVKIINWIKGR